jgi:exopolysaccharide biosynthesis protein
MSKASSFKILLITLICLPQLNLTGQIKGFNKVRWQSEKIAPGLVWKTSHALLEDSILQNINILIVNTNKRSVSISYNPEKNIITSKQALAANALAAVNAGFFSIKDGGSATYIRINGAIIDRDTANKWKRVPNMNGSILINRSGELSVAKVMPNEWYDSHAEYPDVLVTGPILLAGKKKEKLPQTSLVINKHPRTCLGVINGHKLVLLTLDGRTDQAAGMTLLELADLMLSLRCRDAINFDGGGSTTMWVKGKPFFGVVNMPCDNKKFDHEGERAVSDIFIIK